MTEQQTITITFPKNSYREDEFYKAITAISELVMGDIDTTVEMGTPSLDDCLRMAREHGAVVKAWVREDLEAYVANEADGATAALGDKLDHVIDQAAESGIWEDLSDCTEDDWEKVRMALNEGAAAEGITDYTF